MLLPIFFPQPVMGLALLLWFNALGVTLSWQTAVFAHLVWIVPVVTLVMAIQMYGFDPALEEAAYRPRRLALQVLREVTLPILWPGIWSGALFAFLLSWGNFPLSLYTTGPDTSVPEWLYAKMVAGYTPMVPALGTMSTIAAAAVLLLLGLTLRLVRRRESRMTANRWQRFADWDARPLRLDRFAREDPAKGFSAMKSPADPAPSRRRRGRPDRGDGRRRGRRLRHDRPLHRQPTTSTRRWRPRRWRSPPSSSPACSST